MRPDLAPLIDHTLLRPDAIRSDFERLCMEAAKYRFAAVCVGSAHVALCTALLRDCQVAVAATVGFPLGSSSTAAKRAETAQAVRDGASEIDVVCRVDALKEDREPIFLEDIGQVVAAARGRPVKVILETCLLSDEEKRRGARWSQAAGAAFVKTSTGFGAAGATVDDIRLLRAELGLEFGIKASGGIRDAITADSLVGAGATRLGTSAGVAIVTSCGSKPEGY